MLGGVLGGDGLGIAAGVEFPQVEFVGGDGLPEAQGVDGVIAITRYRGVVGHRQHVLGIDPVGHQAALVVRMKIDAAPKLDALGIFRALQLPGVAVPQPVIRLLDLEAIVEALAEHAVFIAQAVALDRQLQGGAGIEKAGRQPAQAAVAQARVGLGGGDLLQQQAEVVEALLRRVGHAQVEHGVGEGPAHEEFQGQIVGALAVGLVLSLAGALPALHEAVAHDHGQGAIGVIGGTAIPVPAKGAGVIALEVQRQALRAQGEWRQVEELLIGLTLVQVDKGRHQVGSMSGRKDSLGGAISRISGSHDNLGHAPSNIHAKFAPRTGWTPAGLQGASGSPASGAASS